MQCSRGPGILIAASVLVLAGAVGACGAPPAPPPASDDVQPLSQAGPASTATSSVASAASVPSASGGGAPVTGPRPRWSRRAPVTRAPGSSATPAPTGAAGRAPTRTPAAPAPVRTSTPTSTSTPTPTMGAAASGRRSYPWHTRIVATTFWVGEIFDPSAEDGSQRISTYDSDWWGSYGGCDGIVRGATCATERRVAANGYFPTSMVPRENPFYLDLPFDDLNDPVAFARRGLVVPWAKDPAYAPHVADPGFSLMKNRWVRLRHGSATCYGQIEDAGPGQYHDEAYVFGAGDRRPANTRYNGAGLDVSPALNGCLGLSELDGQDDLVDWQFVEAGDVPAGPWTRVVTTRAARP